MQVGCFGGLVFSVDSNKVFTMQDIQGSTGSDWATHNTINGKPKSELTGQNWATCRSSGCRSRWTRSTV